MQASVTFRHMPPSDPIKEYAITKVERAVEKYFPEGQWEAHVVLSTEKYWHIAHFSLTVKGRTSDVEERSEDMYTSIDVCMAKIETQLRRFKDKLRDHKAPPTAVLVGEADAPAEAPTHDPA